jgi:HSP20 family molecular chaperone IbpA
MSNVNTDDIQAEYKNGILALTLPKLEKTVPQPKRITIN